MTVLTLNINQLLCQADRLVEDIIYQRINISQVSLQLTALYLPIIYSSDSNLCYSEAINAFIGSGHIAAGGCLSEELVWDKQRTQYFIYLIRDYYLQRLIQSNIAFTQQEESNRLSLQAYLSCLFNHYAKLLVVRVDLGYAKETMNQVSIYDFNNHLKTLRDLISNKKTCFEHLEGYAWAIEQGFDHGFHCHLLLIYQGNERQKDTYLGQMVGEKWQAITNGFGSYFNCNDPAYKRQFAHRNQLGLGMVYRDSRVNNVTAENAINMALYLTEPSKMDQAMKVTVQGMRSFGHGQYRNSKRRGLLPISK